MADYIMTERQLQEAKIGESTVFVDTSTGEIIDSLQDKKFEWRERKRAVLRLADAYIDGAMDKYADRAKSCSTWLEYLASADLSKRELRKFNACHLRLCPICSARKARVMALRLTKVLNKTLADHAGCQLIFLTLTVQNCTGDKLRENLDLLTKGWNKLTKRRPVDRAIKGWFRAIEVTRNRSRDTYHPHIHAVLVVEDAYFSKANGLYITRDKWGEMWQQSLQVDYRPMVGIERAKGKDGSIQGAAAAAAVEAAKYATKSKDYIDKKLPKAEAARVAAVYTEALTRKRMTAMGGWVLAASQELELDVEADDTDLVHTDDASGELTDATAELVEGYNWHFGVSAHLLTYRMPNPDYNGDATGDG